ncbi:MAG: DUF1573 domain-containing protein [Sphingobacteriales bacterium]|nr:MAG: DUF1573 domain-containing protein [Sphingobacteriales bacterium]
MKKYILALGLLTLAAAPSFAGDKKKKDPKATGTTEVVASPAAAVAVAQPMALQTEASNLTAENMAFSEDLHDFGTVTEGENADFDFIFTNTGAEPIIIQRAQPACGCTASDWTKEPILPGKTGYVKASYHTQGRPGPFTKTVTVLSNAGAKVLTFKGEVEKAPTGSVPEPQSIIKTN